MSHARKARGLYKRLWQLVLFILITCCIVVTAPIVRADTTLTSTNFAVVYQDVDIVRRASQKRLDEQVFKALSNPDVPNDVRAAIINALGWSFTGQQNAKVYFGYIASTYRKKPPELTIAELTPEELFALGLHAGYGQLLHARADGRAWGGGAGSSSDTTRCRARQVTQGFLYNPNS